MVFKIHHFQFVANSMEIQIYNINLYGFDIEYVNITEYTKDSNSFDSIQLKLQTKSCSANGTLFIPKYGIIINSTVKVSNFTLFLPLQFFKGSDQLIEKLTVTDDFFYSHLSKFDISFRGPLASIAKKYIPLIRESLLETINNNTISYPLLTNLIEDYGSQLFEQINLCIRSDINKLNRIEIPIKNRDNLFPIIQSPIIDFLRYFLNDLIGDFSNPLNFNNVVNRIADGSECLTLSKMSEEFNFSVPIVFRLSDTIEFKINEISATGFNTWSNLSFLQPAEDSDCILDSFASLGDIELNFSSELNFTLIDLNDMSKISFYSQKFDFCIQLVNNTMSAGFQIVIPKNAGSNYTNSQFLDIDCLLKLINLNETGMTNLNLSTAIKKFDCQFDKCFFFGLIQLFIDEVINRNLDIIPKFMNGYIYEFLVLKTFKNSKNLTCENIKSSSNSDMNLQATLISFGVAAFVGILLGVVVVILTKIEKEQKNDGKIEEGLINEEKRKSKIKLFWRTDEEASLMMHPFIPLWIRLIIPVLLLSNVALFVSSNTALGASIIIKLIFGDSQNIYLPSVFDFTLISSVVDIFDVGKYFISILICVLSFIWPFVKLIIMIIIWFLPSTILKFRIRSRILSVLNVLGKWSLLDSYLVIMIVIAFHMKINFPIYNTKDIEIPIKLNVHVYPAYGFITLILGTLMSLAMSEIICAINRKANEYKKEDGKSSKIKICIFKSQNWIFNSICLFLLFATLSTFSLGLYFNANSFNISGYTGWFMDVIEKETEKSFNAFDIGVCYSKSVENPNVFTIRFTQIVFFLVTIIIPYIHIISMLVLLFINLSKKKFLRFYHFNETLYAWSCLDVFFVSIITSSLVIPQIFLNAVECDYFRPIVKKYNLRGYGKCFEVCTEILSGPYFLLSSTFFYTIVNILFFVRVKKVTKDDNSDNIENEMDTNKNEGNEIETNKNKGFKTETSKNEENEIEDIES